MKKVLLVGIFVLSAISFANTMTKADLSVANNNKIETSNNRTSHVEDWWVIDTRTARDRK
ncbi:MAG: hypothetical protein ACRCU6_12775 [Fusobacteriaceae bacterium]